MSDDPNGREVLLNRALSLVTEDRNKSYDEPIDNFQRIADLWNPYLDTVFTEGELQPHDVAVLNILQKVARLMYSPDHADSWTDIAGYAACGWDCIVEESLGDDHDPALALVLPLGNYEDDLLSVRHEKTGWLGEALFYGDSVGYNNKIQVERWALSHNHDPSCVRPGYWYTAWEKRGAVDSIQWEFSPDEFHNFIEVV